ncbi:hypothetical protein GXW82_27390 [Streptacidiphilus sp. 4-A2]|nr:hypothetical protein [Streptacidiphilus sp. 4-A2]
MFDLQDIATSLTNVQAVSWDDDDSVVVLGQSLTSAKTLAAWQVDGSTMTPAAAAPQATSGMTTVSALEADPDPVKEPLLGDSNGDPANSGRVYVWQAGANAAWRKLLVQGESAAPGPMPSYPG